MRPLTREDFPLTAIGHGVFRKTESSPICTCADQEMAAQIALRMNRDEQSYNAPLATERLTISGFSVAGRDGDSFN